MVLVLSAAQLVKADNFKEAITEGKVSVDFRYRYEFVDQDGFELNAHASTFRLRLGYTTKEFYGFTLHVDMESINIVGMGKYNSTDNGKTEYPIVADPVDTELNQAYLDYAGIEFNIFRLGRQRIILDNQRFIGNVGWRQNEQTFDAFRFINSNIQNMVIDFMYIKRVNTIFGAHHGSRSAVDLNGFVFNLNYEFTIGNLIAYVHFFDYRATPEKSHQNYGARFTGEYDISEDVDLVYTGEFATQHDFKDGSNIINASYFTLEGGCKWRGLTAKVGYERLGGDGTYGFQTPFATLHAFNGWADKFLVTPRNGLRDFYFLLSYPFEVVERRLTLMGVFHKFDSDHDSLNYGTEFDLMAKYAVFKGGSILLKFASYNANEFATNTTKFWISFDYKF
jgi:hypothetical protein